MKKNYFYVSGFVLLILLLIFPNFVGAKSKTSNLNDRLILIQYKAVSKKCTPTVNDQVGNFGWTGWKMQSGVTDYKVNFSNRPANLPKETISSIIDLSFSTLQGAGGGILFHNAGESSETNATNDGQNTIMWRNLPTSVVALTYIWIDGNNRLTDADTVFNRLYPWSSTPYNGKNDCSGKATSFDLRNVATHEFGHWMGLGDLYNSNLRDLTMYGYASRGELKKDSLGVGDVNGVLAVWP